MHANLEEILSVQSDSFELEKKKNVFNFNDQRSLVKGGVIGFSEIFKQLREKHFKKKMTSMHHLMIKDISLEFQLANTNIIPVPMTQKFSEKFSNDKDPMIVLCKFLPIKLIRSELGIYTAEIIKDSNQFYLSRHLLNGNYKKVLCIGMLRHYVDESCRVEITRLLRKTFNCIPIFLNYDVKEMFLTSHEIFSMLDSLILSNYSTSLSIDKVWGSTHSAWEVLREINKNYCQILNEFKNSEYETLLISDYHLILTPKLLIQQGFKLTIGYYFNANFPTFEVFRLFPFKDEFLEGLLQCDLIYFNCFEQARPFFLAMFLEKNIDLLSKSGLLYFTYKDKPTFIKLKSVTVDSKAIHSLKKIPIPAIKTLESDKYNIILGMDRVSELTGIEQKMRLIVQWVQETNNEYNIKLIQILQKPYYGGLTEKQKIWLDHIRKTEKELNSKFAEPIIELWEIDPNEEESLYLMSKVRILLNTSIKNEYCIDSMKFVLATERFGNVLISEFLNYNKSCSSIFSFNPLKYIDFKQKIENLLKTPLAFSKELNQSDVFYLLKYPVESWFSEIFADLKSINISKPSVIPPQKILYNPSLPFFEMDQFQQDYHKSKNRIFIFEFFGVLARSTPITDLNRFSKKSVRKAYQLNENLMKALNILIQDEKNTVYVITSKSASNLDIALGNIPNIGLAAESGYLYKLKGKNKWSKLVNLDWSWKEVVKKNMENYTKNTLGSTLEIKESALVWHYDDVPLELAEMQSKSLIKHLKSSLEKIKEVDIFLERKYIEARPVGISKATFVTLLLKSCQMIDNVDFIMVIGEDRGMFGKVREFIKENSLTGREV